MNKVISILSILFAAITLMSAQAPSSFNYQAKIKDNQDKALADEFVSLRISIIKGNENGDLVYRETHEGELTSASGLVALSIGDGSTINGNFADIDWGNDAYFMRIDLDAQGGTNYEQMGTSKILSVPFALYSNKSGVADFAESGADDDPANELQELSISGNELTISNGNTITIPTGGTDADADPQNELQDLNSSKNNEEITIDITDGSSTTFNIADNDSDGSNEIQDLSSSKSNNEVTVDITDGGSSTTFSVEDNDSDNSNELQDLNSNRTNTDITIDISNGTSTTFNIEDGDFDDENEFQDISSSKSQSTVTLQLTDGNSTFFEVDDDDNDPDNELQLLTLTGSQLKISDGNTVILPTSDSPWSNAMNNLYYNDGNVGIGTTNPIYRLEIVGNSQTSAGMVINNLGGSSYSVQVGNDNTSMGNFNDDDLHLFTDLKRRVTIDGANGRVGIGTQIPQAMLHLSGNTGETSLRTEDGGVINRFGSVPGAGHGYVGTGSNHDFRIRTNNSTKMLITPSGYVGIGTLTPEDEVHISGTSANAIRIDGPGNSITKLGSNTNLGWVGTVSDHDFHITTGGTTRMRVSSSGLIGIRESNPQNELHITEASSSTTSPQLRLQNNTKYWTIGTNSSSGSLRFASTTGSLWFIDENGDPSSLRPARDNDPQAELNDAMKKIMTFIPVIKNTKSGSTDYAFDIDELKSAAPEFIVQEEIETENEGLELYHGIKYTKIIPVLTKALQEQHVQIQSMEEQIVDQTKMIQTLLNKMEILETKMESK